MAGKITALPSVIVMPDGSEKEQESFSHEELEKQKAEMCRRIGAAVSEQYADSIRKWNEFAKGMTA